MGAGLTPSVRGAILAGGRSARLGGEPKGLLHVGGQRMLDHVAAAVHAVCSDWAIVSDHPDATAWYPGARVIGDLLPGGGAAAGIHAALRQLAAPLLVVAWDLPFVSAALLTHLATVGARGGSAHDAVLIEGSAPGQLEPLCAWYTPPVADAIERGWTHGSKSLHAALAEVRCTRIARAELVALGGAAHLLQNVNTPEDLAAARAHRVGTT